MKLGCPALWWCECVALARFLPDMDGMAESLSIFSDIIKSIRSAFPRLKTHLQRIVRIECLGNLLKSQNEERKKRVQATNG